MTEPNGVVERRRALGAIVLALGTLAAILLIVAYGADNAVANVLAGGLVVTLKDTVKLFSRSTEKS